MPPKRNPLKLNKLQLRTLTLAQLLAQDPNFAQRDEATGAVTLLQIPHAHGDHLHIGRFTVSTRELAETIIAISSMGGGGGPCSASV